MHQLGAMDFFEVRKEGMFSASSLLSMSEVYLPMLGSASFAAYFALLDEKSSPSTHEHLLSRLSLSPGEFYEAMRPLEALGLVETRYRAEGSVAYFVYHVYPPLDPASFLSDILFKGTLEKYIGEEAVDALSAKYFPAPKEDKAVFEDVSETFPSFFSPNLSDPLFKSSGKKLAKKGAAKTLFDYRKFASSFERLGGKMDALSEGEVKKIERLGALYGLSSETSAEFAFDCYEGYGNFGKRIDFAKLENRCKDSLSFPYLHQDEAEKSRVSSDSVNASLLRVMDKVSPVSFLAYLQKGHKPASSDLKLINHLASELGLADPCINALLWYTLLKNDNALPFAYAEKIGACLVREGCRNARDAWDYLCAKRKKEKKEPSFAKEKKPSFDSPKGKEEAKQPSDEEVDEAMAKLFGGKGK